MAVDNKKIAQEVLEAVGGKDNVTSATHCMTRLRLNLKDMGLPNEETIKNINGVIGVVKAGGQFQVIIGQNVPKVYAEFCAITGLAMQESINENLDGPKEKLTLKKLGGNIMNYLAGSMTPMITAMMGASLCKALLAILGPDVLKLIDSSHNFYILLNMIFDGFFYYLPIMVGYNAAKKMNIPVHMGALMGGILLAPAFIQMVAEGTPFDILGINVTMVNYSQSVVPVLLSVAFMGFLYRGLSKIMPDTLDAVFTPFLTILISVPVAFIALAPLGNILSKGISSAIVAFTSVTGFIGVGFVAAIWQFLVMTGMHVPVIMTFMVDFMANGYQTGAAIAGRCSAWAVYGVALGAFLRMKNKDEKAAAGGMFISGFVGGVTEPTMYGLCMKYRRCFIPVIVAGFVGGAYLGITHVCEYTMSGSSAGFLKWILYLGGPTSNLINGLIGSALSFILAVVLTYFFGFTKEELQA